MTTVLVVEGVLAWSPEPEDEPLLSFKPDPTGLGLYAALKGLSRVVLASSKPRRDVEHFTRIQGIPDYAGIELLDERTVQRLRAAGDTIGLYVDADITRTREASSMGVPTLLYTRPALARPGLPTRPSSTQRSWGAIMEDQQRQSLVAAAPRLTKRLDVDGGLGAGQREV